VIFRVDLTLVIRSLRSFRLAIGDKVRFVFQVRRCF